MNNKAVSIWYFLFLQIHLFETHTYYTQKTHLIYSMLQYCPYVFVTSVSPPVGPMIELIGLIWRRSVWPTTVTSFVLTRQPPTWWVSPRAVFHTFDAMTVFSLFYRRRPFYMFIFRPIMATTFSPLTLHRFDVVNSRVRVCADRRSFFLLCVCRYNTKNRITK